MSPLTEADTEATVRYTFEITDVVKLFSLYSFPLNMLITYQLAIHSDGKAYYSKLTPPFIVCFSFLIPFIFLSAVFQKLIELLRLKCTCEGHPLHTISLPPPTQSKVKIKVRSINSNATFNLFCSWKWALMDSQHLLTVAVPSAFLSCRKLSYYIQKEWLFTWQCPVSFASFLVI